MAIQNRQLQTLLALITNATEVVERHLASSSYSAEEGHNDPELRTSIYTIEAACAQLVCKVARPSDVLVNVSLDSFPFFQAVISFSVEIHGSRSSRLLLQ